MYEDIRVILAEAIKELNKKMNFSKFEEKNRH